MFATDIADPEKIEVRYVAQGEARNRVAYLPDSRKTNRSSANHRIRISSPTSLSALPVDDPASPMASYLYPFLAEGYGVHDVHPPKHACRPCHLLGKATRLSPGNIRDMIAREMKWFDRYSR